MEERARFDRRRLRTRSMLPPCGRCREMMWQLNAANKLALVILSRDRSLPLGDLLPLR